MSIHPLSSLVLASLPLREVHTRRLAEEKQRLKAEGLTVDRIDARKRDSAVTYRERYVFYNALYGYFPYAARIGRKDLIEKYLRIIEQRVIAEEHLNDEQSRALVKEFRERLAGMMRNDVETLMRRVPGEHVRAFHGEGAQHERDAPRYQRASNSLD